MPATCPPAPLLAWADSTTVSAEYAAHLAPLSAQVNQPIAYRHGGSTAAAATRTRTDHPNARIRTTGGFHVPRDERAPAAG